MSEVASEGRTVLFVSHNMAAVLNLCMTGYWLDKGQVVAWGETGEVMRQYLSGAQSLPETDLTQYLGRAKDKQILIRNIRLLANSQLTTTFVTGETLMFEVECEADPTTLQQFSFGFVIKDATGMALTSANMNQFLIFQTNVGGRVRFRVKIDHLPLSPGTYSLSLYLGNGTYDLDVS